VHVMFGIVPCVGAALPSSSVECVACALHRQEARKFHGILVCIQCRVFSFSKRSQDTGRMAALALGAKDSYVYCSSSFSRSLSPS
jgi:hypothetical protein